MTGSLVPKLSADAASAAPALPVLATPWDLTVVSGPEAPTIPSQPQVFIGRTVPTPWPATYGGDLSVGALSAATRSARENQRAHSLQISFLRPGDPHAPVEYRVECTLDGFRYANRIVHISQGGIEIAVATVALRVSRAGEPVVAAIEAPNFAALPCPDALPTAAEAIAARAPLSQVTTESSALDRYWAHERGLDTRHLDGDSYGESASARTSSRVWVRFSPSSTPQEKLLDTPSAPSALISYLADDTILEPALASLGYGWLTPGLFSTTVQQSLWFHDDFDPRGWVLFVQRLVSRAGDHVVCSGEVYTRAGALVASVLQEGIMRLRSK